MRRKINATIEQRRAQDDFAIGHVAAVFRSGKSEFIEAVYQQTMRRMAESAAVVRADPPANINDITNAVSLAADTLAVVGFWTVVEAMEREAREAGDPK
jgi:hypothetical protein